MQLRHIGRQIGVAFIGTDDDAAGLGDREIATGHPGIGREDQGTGRLALRLRQVVLGRGNKAGCRLCLIDRSIAMGIFAPRGCGSRLTRSGLEVASA